MTETLTSDPSRTAELLLVRLLAIGRSSPGAKRVRGELSQLGANLESDDAWGTVLGGLRSAGLLAEGKGLRLTDAGRARGLKVLGLSELPPKTTWPTLRDQYLLGVAAGAPEGTRLRTKGELSAFMLKRQFELRVPEGATVNTAAIALVCKELGFPGVSDFKALQAAVLGRLLEPQQPLPANGAVEQFLRVRFGARQGKVSELRQALIAGWVRGKGPSKAAEPATLPRGSAATSTSSEPSDADGDASNWSDLLAFAAAAVGSAAASTSGWFGDNKVFIAHAWRAFRSGRGPDLDLAAFKSRLLEANRRRLLTLSRADLVAAMDPADVRESETRYLNAEFHFILIERGAR